MAQHYQCIFVRESEVGLTCFAGDVSIAGLCWSSGSPPYLPLSRRFPTASIGVGNSLALTADVFVAQRYLEGLPEVRKGPPLTYFADRPRFFRLNPAATPAQPMQPNTNTSEEGAGFAIA